MSRTALQGTPLADHDAVASVLARAEKMLRPDSLGSFSAAEPPVSSAIRAICAAYGLKHAAIGKPGQSETTADALLRIARGAGLIAREVTLDRGWQRSASTPLIAFRTHDGAPLALLPGATQWRCVDGTMPRRPARLDEATANGLEARAWVLTPAFPDRPLKNLDVLGFGMRSSWRDIGAFAATSLLAGGIGALIPVATETIVDTVIPGRELTLLYHITAMLSVLFVATLATRLSAAIAMLRIDGRTGALVRVAALDRMVRLACHEHDKMPAPPAAVLITRCVQSWHRGVWHIVFTLLSSVLIALPSLVIMASIAPMAAGLAIALMLTATLLSAYIAKRQLETLFNGPCSPTSWLSISYEALANIDSVRGVGAESRFFTLFSESFLALKERFLAAGRIGAALPAIESALTPAVMAVGIGAVIVLHKTIPEASTITFSVAMMTTTAAAAGLVHAFSEACMLGLQRRMIGAVLDSPPPAHVGHGHTPHLSGKIEIVEASVTSGTDARYIIDHVDLEIEPGEHIGIAGASGSGKSTLLNAILGLTRLSSGQVRFDGIDLSALDSAAVRRQIGSVGQMGRLFPGTILDNITAGVPLAESDVWSALEKAALADDVRAMPLGLHTPLGDAESVLSGGQVQRVLIARALAQNQAIIVLDEPTSALDPETERKVAAAIDKLDATVITIAHRLDTLKNCDRIVVMDNGRIVEIGSFEELIEEDGVFANQVAAEIVQGGIEPVIDYSIERLNRFRTH